MSAPQLEPPKQTGPPPYATVMPQRPQRRKYHANRGHARNAVRYKMTGWGQRNGELHDNVAVYRLVNGDYVLVADWKRGQQITAAMLDEVFV